VIKAILSSITYAPATQYARDHPTESDVDASHEDSVIAAGLQLFLREFPKMNKFGGTQTSDQITDHMSALLSSEHFSTSPPRLADLLSFCVKAALSEESDSLKETTIGVGVFGRPPGYEM
jgi:hypothetical protein